VIVVLRGESRPCAWELCCDFFVIRNEVIHMKNRSNDDSQQHAWWLLLTEDIKHVTLVVI
jgi:hypothetical protein